MHAIPLRRRLAAALNNSKTVLSSLRGDRSAPNAFAQPTTSIKQSFEALEPRVLLSGSLLDAAGDAPTTTAIYADVSTAAVDLEAAITKPHLAAEVISGDRTQMRLPVQVTNRGDAATGDGTQANVNVYARRVGAADASGDVLVAEWRGLDMGLLQPGYSRTFYNSVTLPRGLDTGDYVLVAHVDAGNAVAETSEQNNQFATPDAQAIDVTRGFVAYSGRISSSVIPDAVAEGSSIHGKVVTELTNVGNLKSLGGKTVDLTIVARPAWASDNSHDIVLGSRSNMSVGHMQVGASLTHDVWTVVPETLEQGRYRLVSIVDATNAGETPEAVRSFEVASPTWFTVGQAVEELAVAVDEPIDGSGEQLLAASLSTSSTGQVYLPIRIVNTGNVPLAAHQYVDLQVEARPVGAADGSADVLIDAIQAISLEGLAPGEAYTVSVGFDPQQVLAPGEYNLVATVVAGSTFDASIAAGEASTVGAITVEAPQPVGDYVALEGSVSSNPLPTEHHVNDTESASVQVRITNVGTIKTPGPDHVDLKVIARPVGATDNSGDIVLGARVDQYIGHMQPGEFKDIRAWSTLSDTMPLGDYEVVVWVDASGTSAVTLPEFEINTGHIVSVTGTPKGPSVTDAEWVNAGHQLAEGELLETDAQAIARWDVVPFQTFTDDFGVGVVAFHVNGIDHVAFRVNGGEEIVVTEPTLNPRTGVEEYWINLNAQDYTDGAVTVTADVVPVQGTTRSLSLPFGEDNNTGEHELTLYANAYGSLNPEIITIGPDQDLAEVLMTVPDGGEIRLLPGQYDMSDMRYGQQFDRWVTIRPADGVTRDQVVISPFVRELIEIKGSKIRWQSVTFDFANILRIYPAPDDLHWFDNVHWTDSNGWAHEPERYHTQMHPFGDSYMTDSKVNDMIYGAVDMQIVRNVHLEKISGDVFQNSVLVLNSTITNVDSDILDHHSDIFQYWVPEGTGVENVIAYNVVGRDLHAQHFFMRMPGGGTTFEDFAFVNIDLQMKEGLDPTAKSSQLYTTQKHILFRDVYSAHRIIPRLEGDALPGEGFTAEAVVFEYSTLSHLSYEALSPVDGVYFRLNQNWVP